MTVRMAITYEEFVARATAREGAEWAAQHCAAFGRSFARTARETAETAAEEDAAALRRVADMMDPDLRQEDV